MAEVRLWTHPRKDVIGGLPRVCMKCGAPATTSKVIQFAWYPLWLLALVPVGVLPFLLVVALITKLKPRRPPEPIPLPQAREYREPEQLLLPLPGFLSDE